MIDAVALAHGGAPRLFAAATEFSSDEGRSWRSLALLAGNGTYPGTVLERLLPDSDSLTEIDPLAIWTTARSSPLISLWLSLYRGVATPGRWDVRALRACSLFEAIGRERLDQDVVVFDGSGDALIDNGGDRATTRELRGKLYVLVSATVGTVVSSPRVFLTDDTKTLWEEVGVWADIRNLSQVASCGVTGLAGTSLSSPVRAPILPGGKPRPAQTGATIPRAIATRSKASTVAGSN